MRCLRRAPPGAVDDEPGEGEDEQELAELGGLEAEEGEFEGATRAAGGEAEDEDERDAGAEEGVDPDPQLAEARVVDPGHQQHPDDAEDAVERLAVDVVMGAAGNVVGGRLGEHEDAEGGEGDGGQAQGPVHVGEAEALADADADRERLRAGLPAAGGVHHSASPVPVAETELACLPKYASRICSAAGAADSAPKPPSSTVTMVTIRGFG